MCDVSCDQSTLIFSAFCKRHFGTIQSNCNYQNATATLAHTMRGSRPPENCSPNSIVNHFGSVDPQVELDLLHLCSSFYKLAHTSRTIPPYLIYGSMENFDTDVSHSFAHCTGVDVPDSGPVEFRDLVCAHWLFIHQPPIQQPSVVVMI